LTVEPPIIVEDGPSLLSLAIHLGRTKTPSADHDEIVYLTGRPVGALNAWMTATGIEAGSVFRKVDRWGMCRRGRSIRNRSTISSSSRGGIVGLDPGEFSAHELRWGYLTEAANRGIPLPEAMDQSRHRSIQQASSYYNNASRRRGRGRAARLV
jgi:integrase